MDNNTPTILIMGKTCLDRAIPVTRYPVEDSKVRSSGCVIESGGGNGANVAVTIARLAKAEFLKGVDGGCIRVKLLTTIGDDSVGECLKKEFLEEGVDLSSALFQVVPRSSNLTNIIVVNYDDGRDSSRTCIHAPGTCGEIMVEDVDMDQVFEGNVIHFHSDTRDTAAARIVATEAKRRGIPVSVDAERDRGPPHFDALLNMADLVFTDKNMCGAFLRRCASDKDLVPCDSDSDEVRVQKLFKHFARVIRDAPKRIVATRGDKGCISVCGASEEKFTMKYFGILRDLDTKEVVDTTGAGDSFIGAYIAFTTTFYEQITSQSKITDEMRLRFSSWVAGHCVRGIGRSTIPEGEMIDETLGKDEDLVAEMLMQLIE